MRYVIMLANVRARDKMMATLDTEYTDFEQAETATNSVLIMLGCLLKEPTQLRTGSARQIVELWNAETNEKIYVAHIETVPAEE